MKTTGKRWDGTEIPITAIGLCAVQGCGQIAYSENCNAESDEDRMHWHGTLHVISARFGSGMLCPKHAEEAREEWREARRRQRLPSASPGAGRAGGAT
jgi:hypothetical protein